jgi:hypothetical protein
MPSLSLGLHLRAADVTLFRIPTLLRFRGQTDSVSERNCFIIEAEGGRGFAEVQFSRPRATAYMECVSC